MKLTTEQIKQITTGAIRIEEKADGIHFYKCTEKQIAAWTEKNKDLGFRAAGTTGICLDFGFVFHSEASFYAALFITNQVG